MQRDPKGDAAGVPAGGSDLADGARDFLVSVDRAVYQVLQYSVLVLPIFHSSTMLYKCVLYGYRIFLPWFFECITQVEKMTPNCVPEAGQ